MDLVLNAAGSELRFLRRFVDSIWSDLRVSPAVAWRLFRRSLQASYRQSWLGYFWLLVPPLATTATWIYLNAAGILKVGQTELPYPLFVLTGIVLWQVFADALQSPLQQLTSARSILTKSRIPHEALLLAGVIEVLFNFAVRLLVLLPVFIWFRSSWNMKFLVPAVLLTPFGIFALLLLGFSIGLLLTPLGLLYQDVQRGLNLFAVFWFFLTPVIYPPITSGKTFSLLSLNPVTPLLDTTRQWLTSGLVTVPREFVFVVTLTVPILLFAWVLHRLARPHVVARLG